ARAKRSAVARPTPAEAPVMTTVDCERFFDVRAIWSRSVNGLLPLRFRTPGAAFPADPLLFPGGDDELSQD
ncbi:MAG: hypothetical protein WBE64_04700, partial [Xanthobacteraceae bacterium]